jgi:membrane-associated protein
MNIASILNYIELYGYWIIFVSLFFGIVGIPAPEEDLLFLIGVMIAHKKLSLALVLLYAIPGCFTGMVTAYACGKYLGDPFINKYGKYVGLTNIRWEKAKHKYSKNIQKSIVFGFYIPGLRQISPYLAGVSKVPFRKFSILSLIGTVPWILTYIVVGVYAGKVIHINRKHLIFLGILIIVILLIYVAAKYFKKKKFNFQIHHHFW